MVCNGEVYCIKENQKNTDKDNNNNNSNEERNIKTIDKKSPRIEVASRRPEYRYLL